MKEQMKQALTDVEMLMLARCADELREHGAVPYAEEIEKILGRLSAEVAPVTDEQIIATGTHWAKEPGWFEFERNDFIACVRALLSQQAAEPVVKESLTTEQPAAAAGAEPVEVTHTRRGFAVIEFSDLYDVACSLQKSSLATEDAIWLGCNDANPRQLIQGKGWRPVEMPAEYIADTRMHLTREQVAWLLPILQHFVTTGEVATPPAEAQAAPVLSASETNVLRTALENVFARSDEIGEDGWFTAEELQCLTSSMLSKADAEFIAAFTPVIAYGLLNAALSQQPAVRVPEDSEGGAA